MGTIATTGTRGASGTIGIGEIAMIMIAIPAETTDIGIETETGTGRIDRPRIVLPRLDSA
jgi:hypothetical protein